MEKGSTVRAGGPGPFLRELKARANKKLVTYTPTYDVLGEDANPNASAGTMITLKVAAASTISHRLPQPSSRRAGRNTCTRYAGL